MVSNVLHAHTLVILLHHCRNQTALSSCEHLSSVDCHGIGLLALQDGEDDKSSGARSTRQNTGEDFLRVSFIQRFYHNHLQAVVHCGGKLALNDTGITRHAVDAPRVALGCLGIAHCTPFDGAGCIDRGCSCRRTARRKDQQESKEKKK